MSIRWLTVAEVAERLGVNSKTVRTWIGEESLRARRLGPRTIRVSAVDLEEFERGITAQPDSQNGSSRKEASVMNIYEALEQAAALRKQADELRREADELEYEWVGAKHDDVVTLKLLVDIIHKVGESK